MAAGFQLTFFDRAFRKECVIVLFAIRLAQRQFALLTIFLNDRADFGGVGHDFLIQMRKCENTLYRTDGCV